MLKTITIDSYSKPGSLAREVIHEWPKYKVIHITGQDPGSPDQLRDFYDQFLELVGEPIMLGEDATSGDRHAPRTGSRWTEIRYDPEIKNAYRHSSNPHPLHTDGSYVPAFPDASMLYCVASANSGGETVFLDSNYLIDALKQEDPDLLERLESETVVHARSSDKRVAKIIDEDDQGIKLNWNYTCVADDSPDSVLSLKEEFQQFLKESPTIRRQLVAVGMKPGDCVLFKDERLLHGRNGFDPKTRSERFIWKTAVQVHPE